MGNDDQGGDAPTKDGKFGWWNEMPAHFLFKPNYQQKKFLNKVFILRCNQIYKPRDLKCYLPTVFI